MSYKHGVYGVAEDTFEPTVLAQSTVPAYIGSAPIHRIGKDSAEYIKKPFLVSSLREAKQMGLYSDDWATYSLCEAIHAHFMNGDKNYSPIILINLLNPESDLAAKATEVDVTMKKVGKKFVGYINDTKCTIANIALTVDEGTGATIGTPTYSYNGDTVIVEADVTFSSGKEATTAFTAKATYKQIEFDLGDVETADFDAAIESLDYAEQNIGVVPNILVAPVLSEKPEFHALMIQKAIDKIAGKWNFVCLTDIPSSIETYEAAKTWKDTNAYESKFEKVYWPALAYGNKVYHGSTIGAYMMQKIDAENGDVPYISTSNKVLFCDRAVANGKTLQISEIKANELNEVGITTVNVINRGLRLWGSHMANYNHANVGGIAPEDRFDASVRMSMFILNYLQKQYINEIDTSFTRKDIDGIVNGIQTWLDSLVNDGMLLYATVAFNEESNSDEALANGDFVFDLMVTYSAIAKSITFKLKYTNAGLSTIAEGSEE